MIENAVLDQLRTALSANDTRERLNVTDAHWESFEQHHVDVVRALVKEVTYDGTTGAVSLHIVRSEVNDED